MRDRYFRRLYETPADQGAAVEDAPVDDVEVDDDTEVDAPAEETYTRAQLTEMLGPRFAERYADKHEGAEAFKKYAESYENATSLIGRGGHRTPQDEQLYRDLGIEPPEAEPEPEYEAEPLYGAPWAPPQSWDELVALAEQNPRAAAEFAMGRDDLPDNTKAWFFANWASVDAAGAFAYNQAATTKAAQEYADKVAAEIRSQVDPLVHDRMVANGQVMIGQARDTIPGFAENAQNVSSLLAERQLRDPQYHAWFLNATLKEQLSELRDLTGVAIYRNQPAADAAAAEQLAETEAEKTRSKSETGRTAGSRGGPGAQSAMKKKNLEDFAKLKEQGLL